MNSRRDFLKKAAILSGTLGLNNVISMSIQQAMAINADPGSTFYDAEHVVFLMQENRSFDHMFGSLNGVRGFNDPRVKTLPNQNKAWLQSDAKGNTYAPFHVDINRTKITWQGGLPHSWSDQVAARNKGKYDKWVPVKSLMSLGYYKRQDIPFYYAMADAFTICDHHFCSSLTGTTPNRLFFWTGTVHEQENAKPVINNGQAESRDQVFVDWQTFPELLEDHGISWKVYQNELWTANLPESIDDWNGNYGDNPLEYVKRHQVKLSAYFRKNGDGTVSPRLKPEEVIKRYDQLSYKEKSLIDKAFTTNIHRPDYLDLTPFRYTNEVGKEEVLHIPTGDIFDQFRNDVDSGKLPLVSWLVAPQRFSDHTSSPLYGTWYVSEALAILAKNPAVWKKTIFILTYDENDGYFDHLAPFVPPKPGDFSAGRVSEGLRTTTDYELLKDSPIGLGYRVPMIVASPWSKGGYVNSQVFDHTSSLMFLENFLTKKTGKIIRSDKISDWRRSICGDLTSVFRPYHGKDIEMPSKLAKEKVVSAIQLAKSKPAQVAPGALEKAAIDQINLNMPFAANASEFSPIQEKGTRLACALPYQLAVDAKLTLDKTKVSITFASAKTTILGKMGSAGAPFNVYTKSSYVEDRGKNWAFAVKAEDEISYDWQISEFENQVYDLVVNGPNGFFRAFKGSKGEPIVHFSCTDELSGIIKKPTGNLQLLIENKEAIAINVSIIDNIYRSNNKSIRVLPNAAKIITLNLQKSHGWYDFKIRLPEQDTFFRHYAGHVETGKESITDPYMGGML